MPEVVAAYRKFRAKGLRVLSVSADDAGREARLAKVIADHHIDFPVIYDGKGSKGPLAQKNRVTGFPTAFLLDHRGRVRYTSLEGKELELRISELLAEAARSR
jgi:peroxiredoxin